MKIKQGAAITPSSEVTANSAPISWVTPVVPENVITNILYLPISNQAIKNIHTQELQESLVDLLEIQNPRIIPLATFDSKYKKTYDGYSKVRNSLYQRLLSMLDNLPDDVGVAYFEGLRPLSVQKEYFDNKLKETLLTINDKELAYQETSKFVSPFIDNIPTHCTGAAIDITLFRMIAGIAVLIDMGAFGTISGVNTQQETFSNNTTEIQRANRLLLLVPATQAGFVNYGWEWWHYSFGDRAWAYVKGEKHAIYGLAVNKDDPILSMDKATYLKQFDQIKEKGEAPTSQAVIDKIAPANGQVLIKQ
jgi:D-alanyl-D-alanine dipeptidase